MIIIILIKEILFLSADEALKQLEKEKPFEYNWENINGEKALVLQYVGKNNLY